MTLEEYQKAKHELLMEHSKQLKALSKEYAFASNTVKVGDIISDHIKTIMVEKIEWTTGSASTPICVYTGPKLTRKLVPFKNGETDSIWQNNLGRK